MLQPRDHSFSVGTDHTDRDDLFVAFFGVPLLSFEVPGDMDWRGNSWEVGLVCVCDIKDI